MAETVDQAVLYTSCAILLNSADCTKYGRGRIHPDRPQLKLSLQSKFWSLMSRSNFLMYALAFIILCSPLGQRILKKSIQTWSRKGRTSTVSISKERKIWINQCKKLVFISVIQFDRGRFSSPGILPVQLVKPGYIWNVPAAKNVRTQCDDVQRLVWFGVIFTFHQRNYMILFHG